MPELPEVERVRRDLADSVLGQRVASVALGRADVVRGCAAPASLLAGARLERIDRLGKQLALVGRASDGSQPVVCVHLGMTGSLRCGESEWPSGQEAQWPSPAKSLAPAAAADHADKDAAATDRSSSQPHLATRPLDYLATCPDPHTHVVWQLAGGGALWFRDVRRFGGLWTFSDPAALAAGRWARLGPDALTVQPRALHRRLSRTGRAIKAALLDQNLIAGLGNIYVDELLFAAGVAPSARADALDLPAVQRLVRQMRRLLRRAIAAGGSTFRDYVDASGEAGGFQTRHRVYGRAGLPCRRCRGPLAATIVAGRTTVSCPRCQGLGER